MWLGSKHQVEKVTIHDIPVLQLSMTTVNTARDFGVMLDSQLTMSAQVGAACRSAYNYLRQLRPVVRALSVSKEDSSPRICVFAPRLLQLSVVWCYRQPSWFNVFKLYKMLPHVSSVALADPSTSRQY